MKLKFLIRKYITFPKMTEIADEQGVIRYRLKRNPAAFGLKMYLLEPDGSEIAQIRQKIVSLSFGENGVRLSLQKTETQRAFWLLSLQSKLL